MSFSFYRGIPTTTGAESTQAASPAEVTDWEILQRICQDKVNGRKCTWCTPKMWLKAHDAVYHALDEPGSWMKILDLTAKLGKDICHVSPSLQRKEMRERLHSTMGILFPYTRRAQFVNEEVGRELFPDLYEWMILHMEGELTGIPYRHTDRQWKLFSTMESKYLYAKAAYNLDRWPFEPANPQNK